MPCQTGNTTAANFDVGDAKVATITGDFVLPLSINVFSLNT